MPNPKTPEPSIDLTAQSKTTDSKVSSLPLSPGLMVGAVIAVIAIYFGFSTLFGSSDSQTYQGFIGDVESRTEQLKKSQPTSDSAPIQAESTPQDTKVSR